ncbi:MAG: serine/threonine protein kinase [Deltaproteobacteria bacterium]|nr:serine/threonine protein kinase [Deltaproteobacteria bacterium]
MTRQLGGYHILATIGQGGMGDVYLAIKDGPGGVEKLLVLKVLQQQLIEDPEFLAMFLDEGRIAARLNHPHVVQTFETGRDDQFHFIVMEYLWGVTLGRLMQELLRKNDPSPQSHRLFLSIVAQALSGLHYAHELTDFEGNPLHIVHRDATPQNIFVTFEGAVKVMDFGIAKTLDSNTNTQIGAFKGKLGYLPPEQLTTHTVDRRADVFAIGVILFETLAGHRMYQGYTEVEILNALANGQIPGQTSLPASVPLELGWIVARAISANKEQRYATAREFQDDIEEYLAEQGGIMSAREIAQVLEARFSAYRQQTKECIGQQLKLYSDYQHGRLKSATPTAWNLIPRLTAAKTSPLSKGTEVSSPGRFRESFFADGVTVDYNLPGTLNQATKDKKKQRPRAVALLTTLIVLFTSGATLFGTGKWRSLLQLVIQNFAAGQTNPIGATIEPTPVAHIGNQLPPLASKGLDWVEISGEIDEDTVLTHNRQYLLKYNTIVRPGVSLMIEKGAIIKGDKASMATLIIQPGARIIAQGTPDAPIVFTSNQSDRKAGDWGGIVILGNAPVNNMQKGHREELKGLTAFGTYGGNNPDDDSGILEYVRIEYAGAERVPNSDANGLTFGGVGRFTRLNHVQVRHVKDDCFRFLGGTVDGKYLICQAPGDDGFDWDRGYQGRLQFLLLTGATDDPKGAHGLEGGNDMFGSRATPQSAPIIFNATLCGQNNSHVRDHFGVLAKRASQGRLANAIITGFSAGFDVQGAATRFQISASTFFENQQNNVAYPEQPDQKGVLRDDDNGQNEYRQILQKDLENRFDDPGISGCIRRSGITYKPEHPVTGGKVPPDDGFFDTTATYRGAFRNEADNWDSGDWVKWM